MIDFYFLWFLANLWVATKHRLEVHKYVAKADK